MERLVSEERRGGCYRMRLICTKTDVLYPAREALIRDLGGAYECISNRVACGAHGVIRAD